jgi:hypothetical protein
MTERTEQIQGPVDSVLTHLLSGLEAAMWAEGMGNTTTTRVLNRVAFGDPEGGRSGRLEDIPDWAEHLAQETLDDIRKILDETSGTFGEPGRDEIRLVVLAMARETLQTAGPLGQALSPRKD